MTTGTERTLSEDDEIEQRIADGELCTKDGGEHDWEELTDWMGDCSIPNGTVSWTFKRCRKCGEEIQP